MQHEHDKRRVQNYLKLIAEALKSKSENAGSLRKDIWQFLLDNYKRYINYGDFLRATKKLVD